MKIMAGVVELVVTLIAASGLMRVSYRHNKRIWRQYQDEGDAGLVRFGCAARTDDAAQGELDAHLESFTHKRSQGRVEFKLRADDYRVIYEFDAKLGLIHLHYVGNRSEIYKRSGDLFFRPKRRIHRRFFTSPILRRSARRSVPRL